MTESIEFNLDPVTKIAKKSAKTFAETPSCQRALDNFVYWLFRKPNQKIEMMRIEDSVSLKHYEENLISGYNAIPDEHKIAPKRCITERAFDESLYYIDEPVLLKLFEKVILSSADARYAKYNHPSFINIIEQLSPLDARNLSLFKDEFSLPLVDYVYDYANHTFHVFSTDVFLENPDEQDIELQAISIRNLARLGLLECPDKQIARVKKSDRYEKYEKTSLFLDNLTKLKNGELDSQIVNVTMHCSYVMITPFGKSFIETCVR